MSLCECCKNNEIGKTRKSYCDECATSGTSIKKMKAHFGLINLLNTWKTKKCNDCDSLMVRNDGPWGFVFNCHCGSTTPQ